LKAASVKDAGSYTKDEDESPFQQHTFWQTTFGLKYGMMPEPPYRTLKLCLNITGPKAMAKWLEEMKDQELSKRIRSWMATKGRTSFTTFNIPEEMFNRFGVLEELLPVLDDRKIATELCTSFYLVLECLNLFFIGDKRMVSDFY
jgi:hypothetical protein